MVRSAYKGANNKLAVFEEHEPEELVAALEKAEQRALYCQSLVSAFAQSARRMSPESPLEQVSAEGLVRMLLRDYPFESGQRNWITLDVRKDFDLPARDLLYLVVCTIVQNALEFLANVRQPHLQIEIGRDPSKDGSRFIRFSDNGPGVAPEVLRQLTYRQVSTRGSGHGMGLLFARRVMLAHGGTILVESSDGHGASVTLYFDVKPEGLETVPPAPAPSGPSISAAAPQPSP